MIECTCAREKILTICDSKKINILNNFRIPENPIMNFGFTILLLL